MHHGRCHVTSLLKIATAFIFFLVYIESTGLVDTYRFKLEYTSKADIIFKPGSPPPRLLNETVTLNPGGDPFVVCDGYSAGGNNATIHDAFYAFIAYPDINDCSAFWVWDCSHQTFPALNYTICPTNQYFHFNEPSLQCVDADNCCANMTEGWRNNCGALCADTFQSSCLLPLLSGLQ